jgi:hypothetical protein
MKTGGRRQRPSMDWMVGRDGPGYAALTAWAKMCTAPFSVTGGTGRMTGPRHCPFAVSVSSD